MKIQTFKNMKGLIHGKKPKRIVCDTEGVLKIGATEIAIVPEVEKIIPELFHGATGDFDATFTTNSGEVYDLGKVEVRGGVIAPPPPVTVELMELRCRADIAEEERERLREQLHELSNIFDTNSLNFLIK
jgi:hypothetical protein